MQRIIAVKSESGEWVLDVLVAPFDGPFDGMDAHRQTFTKDTNFYEETFTTPLVQYYHGFDENKKIQPDPVVIGRAESPQKRADGL